MFTIYIYIYIITFGDNLNSVHIWNIIKWIIWTFNYLTQLACLQPYKLANKPINHMIFNTKYYILQHHVIFQLLKRLRSFASNPLFVFGNTHVLENTFPILWYWEKWKTSLVEYYSETHFYTITYSTYYYK